MKPSTEKRYRLACHRFFDYLQVRQTPLPSALHGLDDEAARYFDFLWEEGEPLSFGADLLSGLQHFLPETKRHLPFSWRLLGAWRKHELVPGPRRSCLPLRWRWPVGFTDVVSVGQPSRCCSAFIAC